MVSPSAISVFSPFTLIKSFTEIKNRIRKDRLTVAREYGFKLVPKYSGYSIAGL